MAVLKPSIRIPVINRTQDVIITTRYDKVSSPQVFGIPLEVVKSALISISFGLAILAGAYTPQLASYLERIMFVGF
jgi:hypothetical protein